ncbi:Alkaline phosphatase [Fimbriiglobus ruber]|uniref:Alkaline phosphatase n=1 Tax=Fimbriiglobus ruber TaxID=1908690 RepID=A0A225DXH2_9BACT|nr:Alkaline phosphatase [Fimbriiglobus ruber]
MYTDQPIIPAFDPATLANIKQIAYTGQQNGANVNAFMKIGDSNTDTPNFLYPLGAAGYNPTTAGLTADGLQSTWAAYTTPIDAQGDNSFDRTSAAAFPGWIVGEMLTGVQTEVAQTHAAVALITAGTNDWRVESVSTFQTDLEYMVGELSADGVIPILSTIGWDRYSGAQFDPVVASFNQAISDVATEMHVPLLNLWRAIEPLPNNGLMLINEYSAFDDRHLDVSPYYPGGVNPVDLQYGQNMRTLIFLQTLGELRSLVFSPPAVPAAAPWTPLTSTSAVFAAGSDIAAPNQITVYDAATGTTLDQFSPFASSFTGGVRVAVGDLTGDGIPDIVAVPGPGGGPVVQVYSGATGQEIASFLAFEPTLRGGLSVAVGDADGSGQNEIVVGSGVGGGPRVRVFKLTGDGISVVSDFFAFDSSLRNGVSVAAGNFGPGEGVAVGAGYGGAPDVRLFNGATGQLQSEFFAFDSSLRGGVNVAAGALGANGAVQLVAGDGPGGPPQVKIFDPSTETAAVSFYVGDPTTDDSGVRVAVTQATANTPARIVAAPGYGGPQPVQVFDASGNPLFTVGGNDPALQSGAYVAG